MAELPHSWRAYAQLQDSLSRTTMINDRSWGIEAGLDFLLSEVTLKTLPSSDDVARSIRSESRRERNRGVLRRRYLPKTESATDPVPMLEARSELHIARSKVSANDWRLITAVGIGRDYSEIAALSAVSSAAARIRIMRLRRQISFEAA